MFIGFKAFYTFFIIIYFISSKRIVKECIIIRNIVSNSIIATHFLYMNIILEQN